MVECFATEDAASLRGARAPTAPPAHERGNVDQAEMAARELGTLSLMNALSLATGTTTAIRRRFDEAAEGVREAHVVGRLAVDVEHDGPHTNTPGIAPAPYLERVMSAGFNRFDNN